METAAQKKKPAFALLHAKSYYSLGYGTASVDRLVGGAAEAGCAALALTDIETLAGQVHFHHTCRARGLQPITGVEFRRRPMETAGRAVAIAQNGAGYRSLCRAVNRRMSTDRRSDPVDDIARDPDGLLAFSDDPGTVERLAAAMPNEQIGLLFVRPHGRLSVDAARAHSRRLGVPLVADLDVVFPEKADHRLHRLQIAVGKRLDFRTVCGESKERRLRSAAEARQLFADVPDAVDAAQRFAARCRLDLTRNGALIGGPRQDASTEDALRRRCAEALAGQQPHEWTSAHQQQLERELATMSKLGFCDVMLLVDEVLRHCREHGISTALRGSAAGSLVLHLLGASSVDPVAEGLLFERFLHEQKAEWPDIDLDLPWHRRDEVIDWVYKHFGSDKVAMLAAYHTFQRRSALRAGLNAFAVRKGLLDAIVNQLPPEDLEVDHVPFLDLLEPLEETDDRNEPFELQVRVPAIATPDEKALLRDVLPLVQRLIGVPRHLAAHPGGLIISKHPVSDTLPLERAPKGVTTTQYDTASISALGLFKIDLLGNRALSVIDEARHLVSHGPDPLPVPPNDPATLALIDRADTVGCFQLESPAVRSVLAQVPMRSQDDVMAALALVRPGAAAGRAKNRFIERAAGEAPATPSDPLIADRLADTRGVLLYEEDLMLLLSRAGGISLAAADRFRAQIIAAAGEPVRLQNLQTRFLEQANTRAGADRLTAERARRAWAAAVRFAAYSFNKAHAAGYAALAYQCAWLKAHRPVEFACALLNHHDGAYPLRTLAADLARHGVRVEPPHVNRSGAASQLERHENGSRIIRVGLDMVKHLSSRSTNEVLRARGHRGPFGALPDVLALSRPAGGPLLSQRELSALILSGACDGLPPLTAENYPFVHEAVLEAVRAGRSVPEIAALRIEQAPDSGADPARTRFYQTLARVHYELEFLGMHLSAHPVAMLRREARRYGCVPLDTARAAASGADTRFIAMVAAMRRVPTVRGPLQYLTLEDETGLIEAVVLPGTYRRLGERIVTPGPFLVEGKRRARHGVAYIEVRDVKPFAEREQPFAGGVGAKSLP